MPHPLATASWLNPPAEHHITGDAITIVTQPRTDFWQGTFYGFRTANAPAALIEVRDNVTFSVRVRADYRRRYDQAGIIVWLDEDDWFKASVEHEDSAGGRLGSVVTTAGHSDWATRDVPSLPHVWFRLSRRGPDFLLEARTGHSWEQLRIFHVAALGSTDPAWGSLAPAEVPASQIRLGVYACSPEESSFTAVFDEIALVPSVWDAHV
jgi:regulation of enolase protein 1 (concanavalin A-like superfamily)